MLALRPEGREDSVLRCPLPQGLRSDEVSLGSLLSRDLNSLLLFILSTLFSNLHRPGSQVSGPVTGPLEPTHEHTPVHSPYQVPACQVPGEPLGQWRRSRPGGLCLGLTYLLL